jgi:hypothetical protein
VLDESHVVGVQVPPLDSGVLHCKLRGDMHFAANRTCHWRLQLVSAETVMEGWDVPRVGTTGYVTVSAATYW